MLFWVITAEIPTEYVGTVIHESGLARDELYVTTKYLLGDVQAEIRKSLANVRALPFS